MPETARDGDHAIRGVAAGGRILVLAACTSRLCESARRRHGLWPTATAAVGRTMTAAALLALPLKDGGSVTVSIQGDGPLGGVVAAATPRGDVRGYALRPHTDLPTRPDGKLDVGGAVGRQGLVRVTRDLGSGRPYVGSAPLVTGEIGEDITGYLGRSEQVPSLVALGVLVGRGGRVRAAGGLMIQMLPGAPDDAADRIPENVSTLGAISRAIEGGASPEELAETALAGYGFRPLQAHPLRFHCTCSRARFRRGLQGLPARELEAMLREDGGAEAVCRFCGRRYQFSVADLESMLVSRPRGPAPQVSPPP